MNGDDIPPEQTYAPESPVESDDLYGIYMRIRREMTKPVEYCVLHTLLISSLETGKEMLDPENTNNTQLIEEIEELLSSENLYPSKRTTELLGVGKYKLSVSKERIGFITGRPEELDRLIREVLNQQVTEFIPKLKKLDRQLTKALVDDGIITIKRPTVDDMFEMMLQSMYEGFKDTPEKEDESENFEDSSTNLLSSKRNLSLPPDIPEKTKEGKD
jgi:hypothetical protein